MTVPLVSVIIPAYNAERWIAEAVRSVQAQTLADWEMIIVNDGSTDGTSAVGRSFNDPRIQVVDKPNGGVSSARNAGIAIARGTHFAFLDADDAMTPESLQRKVEALQHHGVDWVYGDIRLCDEHLRPTGVTEQATDDDVVRTILSGRGIGIPGISSNILAHRRCFDAGVRFDEHLSNAADQDIALSLASRFTYKRVPLILTSYRVLPTSMSRSVALYQKDHLYLFNKARANGLLDDPAFRRYCLSNAYWAIGGSWWKNAGDRRKALPFLLKAVLMRPALLFRPLNRSV